MHYLLAIILPPVAVLTAGFKPFSFIVSILLTLCFWIPGIIHAILVVNGHKADKRVEKQTNAIIKSQQSN
jgi:uncharacterized membrane protein YqaE (UPF0057 family)|tara:strand:- start:4139 stop:4348 length:210 start_codon:yes stop_codon:yes gene_type:complete